MVRLEKLDQPKRPKGRGCEGEIQKGKANSAAKTDSASAAPQQDSGESSTTALLSSLQFVSLGEYISEIRHDPSWLLTFPLLSAVEAVAKAGFKPELICCALEAPIGGRLCYALDSYGIVADDARVLGILERGYQIPLISKAHIQKSNQKTPLPATNAARQVLDDEVQGLIAKNADESCGTSAWSVC